jgi:uncharacterized membrane protein
MSQTSDVPMDVIVAAFNSEHGAEDALRELKDAKKEGLIGIRNAAVLWKDDTGKLRFKETADMRGGKGATIGGVVGGVVGLIFPPSILAGAAVGAAVGGLSAKLRDSGFPDDRLRAIGEGLTPNTSALIAVIEHIWVREVEAQLRAYAASVVTEAVRADIAAQLEQEAPVSIGAEADGGASGDAATSSSTPPPPPDTSASTGPADSPA